MAKQRWQSDLINDAILDDASFAALPGELADAFGARSALLMWHFPDGEADVFAHSGYFNDDQLANYAQNFAQIDPWVAASRNIRQAPNQTLDLDTLVPLDCFRRTRFHTDYIRAMGDDTAHCMGLRVVNRWGEGYVALQSPARHDPVPTATLKALDALASRLGTMLAVRGRLAAAQRKLENARALHDGLAAFVAMLGSDMRVHDINLAGREMLERRHVFAMSNGRLSALCPLDRGVLTQAFAKTLALAQPQSIVLGQRSGRPFRLTMSCSSLSGRALVIAIGETVGGNSRAATLRQIYSLSGAEAAIALALADGLSLREIALDRMVSEQTVRVQVKHIAEKMDCSRQSDIVRIVLSLPPLADPELE